MSDLKLQTKLIGTEIALVEASGQLDADTYRVLEAKLRELLSRGRNKLVLKLDQLEYISSAGAGVLIGAAASARERGGNLVLLDPHPHVREVFDYLGLSQMLAVAEDRESALAALR